MKKILSVLLAALLLAGYTVPAAAQNSVVAHDGNILFPESEIYAVTVNGIKVPVRSETVSDSPFEIAMFSAEGICNVEITALKGVDTYKLSPSAYSIFPKQDGNKLSFTTDGPKYLLLEMKNRTPLLLIATPLETEIPDPSDPNVLYYGPGVHEAGIINLKSDQTLYIASGAVVIGRIQGVGVDNVKVLGRGILEAAKYTTPPYEGMEDKEITAGVMSNMNRSKAVFFQDSTNCKVDGIGIRNCKEWQSLYICSKNFEICNINTMGTKVNNDGLDIDTVEDFYIHDNFIMCGDDGFGWHTLRARDTKELPTRNVTAKNNTIYNVTAGNGIRFGSSMETNLWENIDIQDTYILKSKGNAVMLDIQDWTWLKNVNIENVYVEDAPGENVIHVQIVKGQYSNDVELTYPYEKEDYRGHIDGVTIKNVEAAAGAGVVINGYDENHIVENITLENISISGSLITDVSQVKTNAYVNNLQVKTGELKPVSDSFDSGLSAAWRTLRGNWFVKDGALKQSGNGGLSMILRDGDFADCRISCDIAFTADGQTAGIIGRAQDGENYYLARLNSKGALELYRAENGTLYLLGSAEVQAEKNAAHSLFLEMEGNTLRCGLGDSVLISAEDSAYSSGKAGIRGYTWHRNRQDVFTVDNFVAETK